MIRLLLRTLAALFTWYTLNSVFADQLISPLASGPATGSSYFPLNYAFDGQPSWDDVNSIPVGGGGSNAPSYTDRYGYIDFGPDWQHIRITSTWTLYRTYSGGDHTPYAQLWWDNDIDTINDEGLTETRFNFNSAIGLSNVGYEQWAIDQDLTATPVAPQGR